MRPRSKAFNATPQVIVVEVFAGGRLERKNLAPLWVHARHDMLDGAVFSRGVHRLENQQHGPIILGIEHVLKLGEDFDSHCEGFLGARFVLGQTKRIARIYILQAKVVIGNAKRLRQPARFFD